MPQPCQTHVNCPNFQDSPLLGNSVEAPDPPTFFSEAFGPNFNPPLGWTWGTLDAYATCYETFSQEHADVCAQVTASNAATNTWKSPTGAPFPPQLTFFNQAQSATSFCPDGSPFTYTVPSGTFEAVSQTQADTLALNFAQHQAITQIICLSPLSQSTGLLGQKFSGTITASGSTLALGNETWTIVGGMLPPGLFIHGNGITATISGTPTTQGGFSFTVEILDALGNIQTRQYTIVISGMWSGLTWALDPNTGPLPPGSTFNGNGDTLALNWSIPVGDDIIISIDGTMSYTGPQRGANARIVIAAPWDSNPAIGNMTVSVVVGGVTVLAQSLDTGNTPNAGTYNFPFTVPASNAAAVQVVVTGNYIVGGPASINWTVTLQQLN